jgi:hypothetical protein
MHRYGLELMVAAEPDWPRAAEYVEAYNAIPPEGDPDGVARQAVIDRYVTANPEVVYPPDDGRIDEGLLARAEELVEDALADDSEEVTAERLGGAVVVRADPASAAHEVIEAAWHSGVLGAAGFALPD